MAARIRFCREAGESLGVSIERLADGLYWTGAVLNGWGPVNTAVVAPLPEGPTLAPPGFAGSYELTVPDSATKAAAPWQGNYAVRVHNAKAGNVVVATLGLVMNNGDDAPAFPQAIGLSGLQFTGTFK